MESGRRPGGGGGGAGGGGLTQAWSRVRAAMRRRASSPSIRQAAAQPAATTVSSTSDVAPFTAQEHPPPSTSRTIARKASSPAAIGSSSRSSSPPPPLPPPKSVPLGLLIPDAGLEPDPCEEDEPSSDTPPLLLMPSTRAGINHERARALFENHGLNYTTLPSTRQAGRQEPPNKLRRVQKHVYIAADWTCHECGKGFGGRKNCPACAHRRCSECTRSPANRIKDVTGHEVEHDPSSSQSQQVLEDGGATKSSYSATRSSTVLLSRDSFGKSAIATVPTALLAAKLEKDDNESDSGAEDEPILASLPFSIYSSRRTSDAEPVLKSKVQIIRRTCHECQKPILPASRSTCENCGHIRCQRCPRDPPKPEKWPHGSPGDDIPSSPVEKDNTQEDLQGGTNIQKVQRVYRKPRQRVRYTCEHCQTVFVGRPVCEGCGHQRCKGCIRFPPRRPATAASSIIQPPPLAATTDALGEPTLAADSDRDSLEAQA